MFLGDCEEFVFKYEFFKQIGNTICVRKAKNVHFRCNYLFWEMALFFVTIQNHQTLQK